MRKDEIIGLIPSLSEEDAGILAELWEEEISKEKEGFLEEFDAERIRREAKEEALSLAREEFQKERKESAIENALEKVKVKSTRALRALIDFDKVGFEDGKITGLTEQIEQLKEECDFLFFGEEEEKPKFTTGITPFENRADLSGLSYKERLKLYREMPEIYKRLVK